MFSRSSAHRVDGSRFFDAASVGTTFLFPIRDRSGWNDLVELSTPVDPASRQSVQAARSVRHGGPRSQRMQHSNRYAGRKRDLGRKREAMAGVFDGLRVLDLSSGIAGPMTTMLLADNGALVTRIESPPADHSVRNRFPGCGIGGKRSALLDLGTEVGVSPFGSLAESADVVVESFAPGTTARLGIDHATLASANPGLITCSITGYGRLGRDRDRPGYDALVAARTGLFYDQKGRRGTAMEYIAGRPGPEPDFDAPDDLVRGANRPGPVFPRTPWPSMGAMYFATLGIAAALRAREVTGEGQWVETSLLQGALAAVCLNWQRVEQPRRAAVLDVARRLAIDRRPLRVRRRPMGAPLDPSTELGVGVGRRRRPLARRSRRGLSK